MSDKTDDNFMPGLPSAGEAKAETGANFAAQLAGGGGDGYVVAEPKKQAVGKATLAFAGLAVVAGGVLWMMRQRTGGPAAASAEPATVAAQTSIRRFLGGGESEVAQMEALLNDTEQIRERFAEFGQGRRVPLDDLKTNPFWVAPAEVEEEEVVDPHAETRAAAERLAEEKRRLRREAEARAAADAAKLRLDTVILGSRPTCIIDGAIVRVGGTVGGFRVVAIDRGRVTVERDGLKFALRLAE